MTPRPPRSTLFPYTTLFRSLTEPLPAAVRAELGQRTAVLTDSESPAHHLWLTADHRALFAGADQKRPPDRLRDRKSTRLNSSHSQISYAVFCLKKKKRTDPAAGPTRSRHFRLIGCLARTDHPGPCDLRTTVLDLAAFDPVLVPSPSRALPPSAD